MTLSEAFFESASTVKIKNSEFQDLGHVFPNQRGTFPQ